jgi:hypothetical protein
MAHWTDSGIPFSETAADTTPSWPLAAAEIIADGKQRVIDRLQDELNYLPSAAGIDEAIFGASTAPEIIEAIAKVAEVFRAEVGRYPTHDEVMSALQADGTQKAMHIFLEREIQIGDSVIWPKFDDNGEFLLTKDEDGREVVETFSGTVIAQPNGWHGEQTIANDDGGTIVIGRSWVRRA